MRESLKPWCGELKYLLATYSGGGGQPLVRGRVCTLQALKVVAEKSQPCGAQPRLKGKRGPVE
jgi:hypothetical protein